MSHLDNRQNRLSNFENNRMEILPGKHKLNQIVTSGSPQAPIDERKFNKDDSPNFGTKLDNLILKAFNFLDSPQVLINYIYVDFLYSLLFSEKFSNEQAKQDFIKFINKNYLVYNAKEYDLKDLKEDFYSGILEKNIIRWYTKESFFYFMINRIFRTGDYYSLYKIRYSIYLLNRELNKIIEDENKIPEKLYRGSCINEKEFEGLKSNIEKSILLNGFISTTNDLKTAEEFARQIDKGTISILFIFKVVKKDHKKLHPVNNFSSFSENEYLFTHNTFVKIESINKHCYKNYFEITCSFSELDENLFDNAATLKYKHSLEKIKAMTNQKRDDFYFLIINSVFGKEDICLKILKDVEMEQQVNKVPFCLGDLRLWFEQENIYIKNGEYDKAIEHYEKNLQYLSNSFLNHQLTLGENHHGTAFSYHNKEEHKKALQVEMHSLWGESSLHIRKLYDYWIS